MLAKLAVKPLLIALAVVSVLLSISGAVNVKLLKASGAADANCVAEQLETSNERTLATTSLVEESLRAEVTELRNQLAAYKRVEVTAQKRQVTGTQVLSEFRKEVHEATITNPSLNDSADVERLRKLEAAYRVRAETRNSVRVQADSAESATPSLRDTTAQ